MEENMSQAARHALRNTIVSRSTVSKKIKVLDSSINKVKILINYQIKKYTEQKKRMKEHMNYIINNNGIKNQNNTLYKCHLKHWTKNVF